MVPSGPDFWMRLSEGIVAEGCGAHAGIHNLREAILEVPSEAAALGIGEGIAVCVVRVLICLQQRCRFPQCDCAGRVELSQEQLSFRHQHCPCPNTRGSQ